MCSGRPLQLGAAYLPGEQAAQLAVAAGFSCAGHLRPRQTAAGRYWPTCKHSPAMMLRAADSLLLVAFAVGALTCSCNDAPDQDGGSGDSEGAAETSAVEASPASDDSLPEPTPPKDSLSEANRQKLDQALMLLLRRGPENPFFSYQARAREDGTVAYGVLIRTSDPSALRSAGLPVGPVPDGEADRSGDTVHVVTARLAPSEIRRAVQLETVLSVSNPSETEPH